MFLMKLEKLSEQRRAGWIVDHQVHWYIKSSKIINDD